MVTGLGYLISHDEIDKSATIYIKGLLHGYTFACGITRIQNISIVIHAICFK